MFAGLTILEPVPEDLEVNKVSSLEDITDEHTVEKPKTRGGNIFIWVNWVAYVFDNKFKKKVAFPCVPFELHMNSLKLI